MYSTQILSDTIKKPFILGGKLHYGTILPHSEKIRPLAFNHPRGIELNFNWLNYSSESVKQLNCYSYSGFAFDYIDFDHPKIGKSINAWVYIEPILMHRKRFGVCIRAGTGISYLSEIYNEVSNPENKFFASHFAFMLLLEIKAKYKITDKLELASSLCYNHISNGGIKQPNYGMNFPTITLGFDYLFNPVELNPIQKDKLKSEEKIRNFKLETSGSIKVQNKTDSLPEKACFVYGFSAFINKRLAKLSAINIGLDYIADGYVKEEISRAGLKTDFKRFACFLGHDLIFGRVNFTINFGVYLYCPFKAKDPIYQKYQLQYKLGRHFYSGFYLLAHGDAAESMGINFSYSFR
jgi:hypothetical protein